MAEVWLPADESSLFENFKQKSDMFKSGFPRQILYYTMTDSSNEAYGSISLPFRENKSNQIEHHNNGNSVPEKAHNLFVPALTIHSNTTPFKNQAN